MYPLPRTYVLGYLCVRRYIVLRSYAHTRWCPYSVYTREKGCGPTLIVRTIFTPRLVYTYIQVIPSPHKGGSFPSLTKYFKYNKWQNSFFQNFFGIDGIYTCCVVWLVLAH
jgi:hypothetical protein